MIVTRTKKGWSKAFIHNLLPPKSCFTTNINLSFSFFPDDRHHLPRPTSSIVPGSLNNSLKPSHGHFRNKVPDQPINLLPRLIGRSWHSLTRGETSIQWRNLQVCSDVRGIRDWMLWLCQCCSTHLARLVLS